MAVATFSGSPLLALRGVTKRFGGVRALDHVDFDLREGEIHALLGENGAGKSTLIKILGGIHIPDAGSIALAGEPVSIRSVSDANRYGIRLIHQELSLAPNLTWPTTSSWGASQRAAVCWLVARWSSDAEKLVQTLGLSEIGTCGGAWPLSALPSSSWWRSPGRCRAPLASWCWMNRPPRLSEAETEALFGTLRRLRRTGGRHGLYLAPAGGNRAAGGPDHRPARRASIGTQAAAQVNQGRAGAVDGGSRDRGPFPPSPEHDRRGGLGGARHWAMRHVRDVSFAVHYGEVLGIAGLVGSGRSELARALFGIDRLDRGEIRVDGRPVRVRRPRHALDAGLVLVPEDRKLQGLIMEQSTAFNLALPWVRQWIRDCCPARNAAAEIVERAVRAIPDSCGRPGAADPHAVRWQPAEGPGRSLDGASTQGADSG